jgi:hypothetical protein
VDKDKHEKTLQDRKRHAAKVDARKDRQIKTSKNKGLLPKDRTSRQHIGEKRQHSPRPRIAKFARQSSARASRNRHIFQPAQHGPNNQSMRRAGRHHIEVTKPIMRRDRTGNFDTLPAGIHGRHHV